MEKAGVTKMSTSRKREASAARLATQLAQTQAVTVTPICIASLPKTRSLLAGSLRAAEKQYVARICKDRDDRYFRKFLRSFRPIPYKYASLNPC
jgi:hypothetical protein